MVFNLPILAIFSTSSGFASVAKSKSFGFFPNMASLTAPPTTKSFLLFFLKSLCIFLMSLGILSFNLLYSFNSPSSTFSYPLPYGTEVCPCLFIFLTNLRLGDGNPPIISFFFLVFFFI